MYVRTFAKQYIPTIHASAYSAANQLQVIHFFGKCRAIMAYEKQLNLGVSN